jgi:hypothetical protein
MLCAHTQQPQEQPIQANPHSHNQQGHAHQLKTQRRIGHFIFRAVYKRSDNSYGRDTTCDGQPVYQRRCRRNPDAYLDKLCRPKKSLSFMMTAGFSSVTSYSRFFLYDFGRNILAHQDAQIARKNLAHLSYAKN